MCLWAYKGEGSHAATGGKRQCDLCMQAAMGWSCNCEACISGFQAIGLNCAQMGDLQGGGHSDGQIKGELQSMMGLVFPCPFSIMASAFLRFIRIA